MTFLTDQMILEQIKHQNTLLICFLIASLFFTAVFIILLIKADKKKKPLLALYIALITIGLYISGAYINSVQSFDHKDFAVTRDVIKEKDVDGKKCTIILKQLKMEKEIKDEQICSEITEKSEVYLTVVSVKSIGVDEKVGIVDVFPVSKYSYKGERFLDAKTVKNLY